MTTVIKKTIVREGLVLLGFIAITLLCVLFLKWHKMDAFYGVMLLVLGYPCYLFFRFLIWLVNVFGRREAINHALGEIIRSEGRNLLWITGAIVFGFSLAWVGNVFDFGIFKGVCDMLRFCGLIGFFIFILILPVYLIYLLIRLIVWAVRVLRKKQ